MDLDARSFAKEFMILMKRQVEATEAAAKEIETLTKAIEKLTKEVHSLEQTVKYK